MNGRRKVDFRVLCPCYKYSDDHQIYCLGADGADAIHHSYRCPSDLKRLKESCCYREESSARCALYKILCSENWEHDP